MFKRVKPLVIHGRTITQPGAAQLAEYMTEERALFVAHLRLEREYTWRMIAKIAERRGARIGAPTKVLALRYAAWRRHTWVKIGIISIRCRAS